MPAWSPDGKRIAFSANLGGNVDIYTLNVDGSDLRRITRHTARDSSPAWHPDGHAFIFSSMWDQKFAIYRIDVAGHQSPAIDTPSDTRFASNVGDHRAFFQSFL